MSTPLLQYRPRSDTINTLLHEAIHAYFFVTSSWRHSRGDDGTGHGAGFQLMADAINNHGGYDITVYHTFHDEVDSYRTHIWQCDGPCRQRPPYFGLVKRSMNRPPGKTDTWWSAHLEQCGGQYAKISQPEMTKKQREALSKKERAGLQKNKIDSWVTTRKKPPIESKGEGAASTSDATQAVIPPKGMSVKRTFEAIDPDSEDTAEIPSQQERQRPKLNPEAKVVPDTDLQIMVQCPICCEQVAELDINHHLDVEHPP
ncbi:hypothetical protein BU24DRAFT_418586 [Aaosphaeria arxii CBS 175.79]|uniref:SprT-like domain-containing protein n=1 Tax=Aaosphaeria arxii CBS 175.79 TaxID=1450172 RepID=A0A6A5Y0M3_9PLEO|nr:uncharacterized protein BU24DRAFT_418586 [Aaosphaeria arxii CBS 175.79]KAF2019002.1 hypothetical protein BU24DRAFT_418586 [Aaosphaeria arxii CBS 175.79]